ncbi:MAG: hypothetical protein LBK76_09945 [Verrucomicrobiales bacterium]|jgi:integrase|nr:hypothetical protein [Verrucomicrobiales bacterium]
MHTEDWRYVKVAPNIFIRGNIYYLIKQVNKKRQRFQLAAKTVGQAVDEAAQLKVRAHKTVNNPFFDARVDHPLGAVLERFFIHKISRGEWRESTKRGYAQIYNNFKKFIGLDRPVTLIRAADLQRWYDQEGRRAKVAPRRKARRGKNIPPPPAVAPLASESRATYWNAIRTFFNWAYQQKIIAEKITAGVVVPRVSATARQEFYDFTARDRIVSAALKQPRAELALVILLGFHAGLRRAEIDHARPEWLDLTRRVIHVRNLPPAEAARLNLDAFATKNGRERSVPMSSAIHKFFSAHAPQAPYLIAPDKRHRGKNRYRYDMRRPVEEFLAAQGGAWRGFHVMRRTFASLLASTGQVTLYEIAKWLGDTITVTEKNYAHLLPLSHRIDAGLQTPAIFDAPTPAAPHPAPAGDTPVAAQ